MKREDIEKAATMVWDCTTQCKGTLKHWSYCATWGARASVDFAIEQVNEALEEAARLLLDNQEIARWELHAAIRALKVKP